MQRKSRKNASMRGMETRTKIIPKKKLVRFTFPRSVLSNRARRRLMKKLAKLSELTPKFFFAQDLTETARRGYDSSAWHRANLVFVMRALRRVGLGNIGLISNESLEYYEIERLLTFHHSLALYREDFISQLNTILGKAGIHQKVKIEGLPTSSEIVAIKTKLRIGELDFKEAYEAVAY